MSPPSPSERSHPPNPPSYGSGRGSSSRSAPPYSAPQPVRPTAYSSLGDALGSGGRQPQYMPTDSSYPPPPSSAGGGSLPSYPHVSPEGRYYYTPSGMPTSSYEYQYHSSSYETPSQYTHSTLPPMRSASPASHPHPPPPQSSSHHPAPHTPYASPFPQSQYAPPPSIAHHWADEQWAPSQSFSPDPVNPMFAGRSDLAQSPQPEARGYASQPYSSTPVNTRVDERAYNVSPKSKGKARERDVASSIDRLPVGEMTPVPIDYSKLFNTYKNIFADCENLYTGRIDLSKRTSSLDEVDRLIRSADLGLRLFNSASPVTGAERRLSGDSLLSAEPENPSPVPAPKRQVEAASNTEGQTCLGCGATSTPEWRRGPLGPRTLCNACGLVYAKLIKKRSREVTSNALTTPSQSHAVPQSSIIEDAPAAMHSPGNGDSEDEDSYENDPA